MTVTMTVGESKQPRVVSGDGQVSTISGPFTVTEP